MPHCIIEYTPNLPIDTTGLLQTAHQVMIDSGLFGVADIKTRAFVVNDYVLGASSVGEGNFIHIIIRLLDGRTIAQKQALTSNMAKTLRARLQNVPSITVDIIDMVRESYAKDVV